MGEKAKLDQILKLVFVGPNRCEGLLPRKDPTLLYILIIATHEKSHF